MRKITIFISLVFITSIVFGQMPMINQTYRTLKTDINGKKIINKHHDSKDNGRLINYGDIVNGIFQTDPTYANLSVNNLFPDSMIKVLYDDGSGNLSIGGPWIHGLGDWVDVSSSYLSNPVYTGSMYLSSTSTYKLDSISILGWYYRNLAPGVVDTMVIEVLVNPAPSILSAYYFAGAATQTNFGVDTLTFLGMDYNLASNSLGMAGKIVYKIPMTAQTAVDTLSNGLNEIKLSTSSLPVINFPYFAATFKFVPGYSYSWADSLKNMDFFRFFSWEENAGGYMSSYQKEDYNASYILPQDVRYNNADTWNGNYVPSFAYTAPFSYEHHLTYYKITCQTGCSFVSIDENTPDNTFTLYPNPVNDNINIQLKDINNASIAVFDCMGKKISETIPSALTTDINLDGLSSGIYIIQVIQSGKVSSQKLIKN